jgi:hypothetical protein
MADPPLITTDEVTGCRPVQPASARIRPALGELRMRYWAGQEASFVLCDQTRDHVKIDVVTQTWLV